ncbi:enoyl-CoA hydratase/isomerase family protein [Auritidibacter ignavus]|uniref:3-hydroxyisobutyryl-CoA hydrolase n=1 Tax=Auritidibacter ignavus TaxID=678932 RepID=A0AAJ6DFB5_9MICC|nr:enoyl-CoA hydratase/isomerase family protein [Auritidibacter ignavus]WGH94228.1 enoyl-CoA hydratase/isomerase family protein [Auritidibacter ignavus]
MTENHSEHVIAEVRGSLGIITLNKPQAMNSLSLEMVRTITATLQQFRENPAVVSVALRGAGDRGFCAGGDVVALYHQVVNDPRDASPFFMAEYQLDHAISVYPKPVLAVMNGVVLGGGVGLAGPSSHRIVTETTRLGMPETGIGFSPDVAGVNYLAQAPGLLGRHLALTGAHISAADVLHIGMADYFVNDESIEELLDAVSQISTADQLDPTIRQFQAEPGQSELATQAEWIDRVYDADTVEQMLSNVSGLVENHPDHPAGKALRALQRNSPTGMKVALEAVKRAGDQTIGETLAQDLRTTMNAAYGHDLREGIRAQLVDKDRNPRWKPAELSQVSQQLVNSFFDPVDGVADLELNGG